MNILDPKVKTIQVSQRIAERLNELSNWSRSAVLYGKDKELEIYPGFDAGFLFRKLPSDLDIRNTHGTTSPVYLTIANEGNDNWSAYYGLTDDLEAYKQLADTPEDALALLAIKLFEEGILKR